MSAAARMLADALDRPIVAKRGSSERPQPLLSRELVELAALGERLRSIGGAVDAAPTPLPGTRETVLDALAVGRPKQERVEWWRPRSWRHARVLLVAALLLMLLIPSALAATDSSAGRFVRAAADHVGVLPGWLRDRREQDLRHARIAHGQSVNRAPDSKGAVHAAAGAGRAHSSRAIVDTHSRSAKRPSIVNVNARCTHDIRAAPAQSPEESWGDADESWDDGAPPVDDPGASSSSPPPSGDDGIAAPDAPPANAGSNEPPPGGSQGSPPAGGGEAGGPPPSA